MKKKYVVVPGTIGENFIGAHQIMKLFGVFPEECVVPSSIENMVKKAGVSLIVKEHYVLHYDGYPMTMMNGLIPLHPQEDGDYSLEKATVDFVREKLTDGC